jgi:hypothetical protein
LSGNKRKGIRLCKGGERSKNITYIGYWCVKLFRDVGDVAAEEGAVVKGVELADLASLIALSLFSVNVILISIVPLAK